MKTITILLSILLFALFITGCDLVSFGKDVKFITPSDVIITEERAVSGFTGLNISAFGKVIIMQGDSETLTIKGSDNLVPLIKTTVNNGILTIQMEQNINVTGMNKDNVLTFTITVKDLTALTVSGASNVEMASLSTSKLALTMSGAGQVLLDKLTAESLNITLSGVGNVKIAGEVAQAAIDISGAGSVDAPSLKIQTANVKIPGLGSATIWVTDQLTGSISGGGNVSYYGNPQTDTSKTGLGNFKSLGSK